MCDQELYFDLDRLWLNSPCQNGTIRLERAIGRSSGKITVMTALKLWRNADLFYSDILWGFKVLNDPVELIVRWVPVLGACEGLERMAPWVAVVWLQQRVADVLSGRARELYSKWVEECGLDSGLDMPEFGVEVELQLIEELMACLR